MKGRSSQIALTLIFILFGLMLAIQFRVRPPAQPNIPYQRAEEIAILLELTENERDRLKEENAILRERLAEMAEGEDQVKVLQDELAETRLLAGLTPAVGPGISIEMSDSQKSSSGSIDPNVFLIHDDDVLKVINELLAAGAEAISINSQRVVSTTEIRCAGPVLLVNGTRIAPPLRILAIGDSKTLENSLKMRGGVADNLSLWGIEIKTKIEQEITVPAYSGSLNFKYASPLPKREGNS